MKFEEYLKTNLEFHEIKLVEYINNSINFGFEVFQFFLFNFNKNRKNRYIMLKKNY